jgi:AraC family transcriptional activator of pobA
MHIMSLETIPEISFAHRKGGQLEFEIFTLQSLLGRRKQLPFSLDRPHRVSFYHIFFISRGSGTHIIDFRPYRISKGDLLFVCKNQVHSFLISDDFDGYVVLFTQDFMTRNLIHSDLLSWYRLYNYHLQDPLIPANLSCGAGLGRIIRELFKEYLAPEKFAKEDILRLLLKLLLTKAERLKRTIAVDQKNTRWAYEFDTFRGYLETHYNKTRNATDYAELMGVSYKHLNFICKHMVGQTAKQCVDSHVILEINRHLSYTDLSTKELTYELGFDEQTNLVKYYKRLSGMTPAQFKQRMMQTDLS